MYSVTGMVTARFKRHKRSLSTIQVLLSVIALHLVSSQASLAQLTETQKAVRAEVEQEMTRFYAKMRAIDLTWMDLLSEDATAVHNGQFLPHSAFIDAEKAFFSSLSKLEITLLSEPVYYVLGPESVLVTQKHSVSSVDKMGNAVSDRRQFLTFVWNKRKGVWKLVFSHFGDST